MDAPGAGRTGVARKASTPAKPAGYGGRVPLAGRPPRLVGATLAALLVLAVLAPVARGLADPDDFEGDWCQHVAWTARLADPTLFPDDPHVAFFSGPPLSTLGVRAAYGALVPALGPEPTARTLGALALLATAALGAALGRRLGGVAGAALVVGILALHSRGLVSTPWGIPRSFALPLHLATAWALAARCRGAIAASFLAAALLYPPALPPAVGGAVLVGLLALRRPRARATALRRGVVPAVAAVVSIAVLLVAYRGADDRYGPRVDRATARSMPEFGPDGRAELWSRSERRFWTSGPSSGVGAGVAEVALTLVAVGALVARRRGRRHLVAPALLAAGLVSFAAAHATLFALHLPQRYVATLWPVAQAAWVASVLPALARRLGRARGPRGGALATGVALALALVGAGRGVARTVAAARAPVDEDRRALHAFLSTLPRDARVAAFPTDADEIPLRARRSVLGSDETAQPYWLGYYRAERARLEASIEAVFATSWDVLDAFAVRHGVAVVVADASRYGASPRNALREPFGAAARRAFAAGEAAGFVLRDPPADRVLFRRGRFTVVRVGSGR